jgi:copper transport protein
MRHRALSGLALTIVVVVLTPLLLHAHPQLKRSTPAAGALLPTAPAVIGLWFTEDPELSATRITLVDASGHETPLSNVRADSADHSGVIAEVPGPLSAGVYTVKWRTAAADGHATSGGFSFTVQAVTAPAGGVAPAPPVPVVRDSVRRGEEAGEPPEIALRLERFFEFFALLALLGVIVFVRVVAPGAGLERSSEAARRYAQTMLSLLAVALLVRLYFERGVMSPDAGVISVGALRSIVFHTAWGRGWLVGALGVVTFAIGLTLARRMAVGWSLAWLGAIGLALYPALTGHATGSNPWIVAVAVDSLHVAAAGSWVGTLLVIIAVGVPAAFRHSADEGASKVAALVRSFQPVALTCATTVVLSGAASAWMRLGGLAPLWESTYGRVLLLKIGTLVIVGTVGGYNWLVATPRLGTAQGARAMRRSMQAEVLIGALVIALTATLVSLPTPQSPPTRLSASSASESPSR